MADLNDPHVSVVEYLVEFGPAQVVEGDLDDEYDTDLFKGRFTHEGKRFRCEMREHFASVAAAREAVERKLRAWTIRLGLKDGPTSSIDFEFAGAALEDRDPSSGGPDHVLQPASHRIQVGLDAVVVQPRRDRFPGPPADFTATDLIQSLWERYLDHRAGGESLQEFAYFVLHSLTKRFNGRKELARTLSLGYEVVNRVGEFSSERGDRLSARKVPKSGEFRPLSPKESRWLRTVVEKMILRLGQYEAGADLEVLSLDDLPDISEA